jgi:hypothetical protein
MLRLLVLIAWSQTCHIDGGLPDPGCTPGEVTNVPLKTLCHSPAEEHATEKMKFLVTQLYATREGEQVEIDHLVPLNLGGANTLINLWPQPAEPTPGYKEKNELEDLLHRMVCRGQMNLAYAQHEIARDWVALFYKLFPFVP